MARPKPPAPTLASADDIEVRTDWVEVIQSLEVCKMHTGDIIPHLVITTSPLYPSAAQLGDFIILVDTI